MTLTLHTFAGDVTQDISPEAALEFLPILESNGVPFTLTTRQA